MLSADPAAGAARESRARRCRSFDVDRRVVDGMGTFGGYAAPCLPLTRVKPEGGIEAMKELLATNATSLPQDAASLVAERPIAASYEVSVPMRYAEPVAQGDESKPVPSA